MCSTFFFFFRFLSFCYCSKIRQRGVCFEMLWNVFTPVWISYRQSSCWLRQIPKWEVVNLTNHGRYGRILSLISPWPMTNHIRKNISGHRGHWNTHIRIHKGTDIFFAFKIWKCTIRSSTRCLWVVSHTHEHKFKRAKSNSKLLLSRWSGSLIGNRQRESGCGN